MKIGERIIQNDNLEFVVIPRSSGDITFYFKPVLDDQVFEELVKQPKPPLKMDGETKTMLYDDPDYLKAFTDFYQKRKAWMFLMSISATKDLTWDGVDMGDPSTWCKYEDELKSAGFTIVERNLIEQGYEKVNCLNQDHLDAARNRFLAGTPETKTN